MKHTRSESLGLMVEAKPKRINTGVPPRLWLTPSEPAQFLSIRGKFAHAFTQAHESSYANSSGESDIPRIHGRESRQKQATSTHPPATGTAQRSSILPLRLQLTSRRLL